MYYEYYVFVFAIIAVLSIYDFQYKRVPNAALVCFLPIALLSPLFTSLNGAEAFRSFVLSLLGAFAGFTILLAATLASKNNQGVGGGDIKLAAILGYIYGPYGIIGILLIASIITLPIGAAMKRKHNEKLHLPFVPFMAVGCMFVTATKILTF